MMNINIIRTPAAISVKPPKVNRVATQNIMDKIAAIVIIKETIRMMFVLSFFIAC